MPVRAFQKGPVLKQRMSASGGFAIGISWIRQLASVPFSAYHAGIEAPGKAQVAEKVGEAER